MGNTPGSYLLILRCIDKGYDTPASICSVLGVDTNPANYTHPRDIAGLIKRLWQERYICRVTGRGFFKLELLDKGAEALGLDDG